jgi:biotin transport system substrate-specific component
MWRRSIDSAGSWRDTRPWSIVRWVVPILVFSAFTAVSGQLKVGLPFSPVLVSAQTFAVLLAGLCLGSRGGALAQLGYIGAGVIGLPVFVGGLNAWRIAAGGVPVIVGPTAGYLVGYVGAAFLVGHLVERGWGRQPMTLFDALALGNLVIYACATFWLLHFVPGGIGAAIVAGVLPFLAGDFLKLILLTVTVTLVQRVLGHRLLPATRVVSSDSVSVST